MGIKNFNYEAFWCCVLFWLPLRPLKLRPTQITSVNFSPTRRTFTATTGRSIRNLDNSWLTATSMSLRTGLVLESASTPGSAEALDNARVKDGATVTIPARRSTNEPLLGDDQVY